MINVVKRITELMERKGWSSYELSAQTGISTNAIYDWFKTGAQPSLGNIVKICEAMDLSLEQFFCGDNAYLLTDEENAIMTEWFALSDLEKQTIMSLIDTFKILKTAK